MIRRVQMVHQNCSEDGCEATGSGLRRYPRCSKASDACPAFRWDCPERPTLLVVPCSAISTWVEEFKATQQGLNLHVAFGRDRPNWDQWRGGDISVPRSSVVVLTSRESLVSRVTSQLTSPRGRVLFGRVVYDEAHEVRGMDTVFGGAARRFAEEMSNSWFVTGTPLPKGPTSLELAVRCWWGDKWWKETYVPTSKRYISALRSLDTVRSALEGDLTTEQRTRLEGKRDKARREIREVASWLADEIEPVSILRQGRTKFLGQKMSQAPLLRLETVTLPFVSTRWASRYRTFYADLQAQLAREVEERRREASSGKNPKMKIFSLLRKGRIHGSLPGLVDVQDEYDAKSIAQNMKDHGWHLTSDQIELLYQSSSKLRNMVKRCGDWKVGVVPEDSKEKVEKVVVFADSPIEAYVIYEVCIGRLALAQRSPG